MQRRVGYLALILVLVASLSFGLVGCSKPAEGPKTGGNDTPAATTGPDRALLLVTAEELAANPDKYFVIDNRAADAYAAGHIPGAINLTWQELATVAEGAAGDANWGVLFQPDEAQKVLEAAGLDTSKTIVLYSDPTGWGEDGRVMWSLASLGITNTRLLDGGFPYWQAAGNEVSTEEVKLEATSVKVSEKLDEDLNVTTEYVSENLENLTIIDTRNKKEYDGATDFGEKRGGHIPGAANIEFPAFFNEDGTLKNADELDEMFANAGAKKDAESIYYCTKGIRSGYATMVARWLGYENARNYDASYYAWAGDSSLSVEK